MELVRIADPGHPMYHSAMALYAMSFPHHEQREAASQAGILRDEEYHFCLIYDGTAFVGLVLYWETARWIYIEHLCIAPELRNRKYGERTLSALKERGKVLILEIDPPVDPVSVRRKKFYERCGFAENPYRHIHPPYHRENSGHVLVVMTYPAAISQEEYGTFSDYLRGRVMREAF